MNTLVNCPACGFRGRLPDAVTSLRSVVCPQCRAAVPVEQLRRAAATVAAVADASFPIWVDSPPVDQTPLPAAVVAPESEEYNGDFMKDEAGRFAQYVAARLAELHTKRTQLADAENRFERMTMEQKQSVARARGATAAEAARQAEREQTLRTQSAAFAVR